MISMTTLQTAKGRSPSFKSRLPRTINNLVEEYFHDNTGTFRVCTAARHASLEPLTNKAHYVFINLDHLQVSLGNSE